MMISTTPPFAFWISSNCASCFWSACSIGVSTLSRYDDIPLQSQKSGVRVNIAILLQNALKSTLRRIPSWSEFWDRRHQKRKLSICLPTGVFKLTISYSPLTYSRSAKSRPIQTYRSRDFQREQRRSLCPQLIYPNSSLFCRESRWIGPDIGY